MYRIVNCPLFRLWAAADVCVCVQIERRTMIALVRKQALLCIEERLGSNVNYELKIFRQWFCRRSKFTEEFVFNVTSGAIISLQHFQTCDFVSSNYLFLCSSDGAAVLFSK